MERTFKFTSLAIKNMKCADDGKQLDYFDDGPKPKLGIRVGGRSKTWFIAYQLNGKRHRYSLGYYPEISLTEARNRASDIRNGLTAGRNPALEKEQYKASPTMADLWKIYVEKRDNLQTPKAASTISEEDRRWNTVISPVIGDMRVLDVTPSMLDDLLTKVAKTGPVSANRLHSLLSVLFKPALAKRWIDMHPLQWVDKPGGQERSRSRVLSDDEIRTIWPYIEAELPNPRDILKLGLLTAARPGEIMAMRWGDIDFKTGIWDNSNNKTDSAHLVPLSVQVLAILEARERAGEYVFHSAYNQSRTGFSGAPHTKSTKTARKRIQAKSGVKGWSAHDLRRTARTILSRLDIEPHIRELVLGHSLGRIIKVYDRHSYMAEKKSALQLLADEIYGIVE